MSTFNISVEKRTAKKEGTNLRLRTENKKGSENFFNNKNNNGIMNPEFLTSVVERAAKNCNGSSLEVRATTNSNGSSRRIERTVNQGSSKAENLVNNQFKPLADKVKCTSTMKNLVLHSCILLFMLIGVNATSLKSQTFVLSEYQVTTPSNAYMISNVEVSSPNFVNYMISTDEDRRVYVTELDFNYPTPQSVQSWYFQLPQSAPFYGITFINGIYTQKSGYDEIFLYGHESSFAGIMAVIKMVGGVPQSLLYRYIENRSLATVNGYYQPLGNTKITSACAAPHFGGVPTMSAYAFVVNGQVGRVLVNSGQAFGATVYKEYTDYEITSVAYHSGSNKFVVSLNNPNYINYNTQIGVGYINNDGGLTNSSTSHFLKIQPPFEIASGSSKVHVQNNNSADVILIQALYQATSPTTGLEGFWITKINNTAGGVTGSSKAVMLPSGYRAVTIFDANDDFNNLQILAGVKTSSGIFNFMLQTSLASFSNNYCRDMNSLSNNIVLRGMNFNNAFFDVLAYGAINGKGYVIEVSDLSSAPCLNTVAITQPAIIVTTSSFPIDMSNSNYDFSMPIANTRYNSGIIGNWLCGWSPAPSAKALIQENPDGIESNNAAEINQIDNYFICSNFEGNCNYKITDILGRILQHGDTQNNVENNIKISDSGIYFISVTDENNNTITSKIIITK